MFPHLIRTTLDLILAILLIAGVYTVWPVIKIIWGIVSYLAQLIS